MPSKTENTSPVRHAIARTTGTTTWTRKTGEEWTATCLNHDQSTTAPNRAKAWTTGSHPEAFCSKCKGIATGKADKITGDRLDIPAPKKAPAKKAAPKKAS
jgi:hypothetical protein